MPLPKIAITIGDPAGVGAEIALKALAHRNLLDTAHWVVIGDQVALNAAQPGYRDSLDSRVRIVSPGILDPTTPIRFGQLSAEYGLAAIEYVRLATEMCLLCFNRPAIGQVGDTVHQHNRFANLQIENSGI